jgi:peptidoglycan hydrolase-like amidase
MRLRAPATGSFLVHGRYPHVDSPCRDAEQPTLTARYPGTLAVRRAGDGTLSLLLTLPFERYLEGIAEIPPTWPRAALEAQVIAARTYALATTGWSGEQGATLDTPICATSACQVYGGIPVPPVPGIGRWHRAVRDTAGQVLLTGGRPAETLYFSTSNGRTYGNDEVSGAHRSRTSGRSRSGTTVPRRSPGGGSGSRTRSSRRSWLAPASGREGRASPRCAGTARW